MKTNLVVVALVVAAAPTLFICLELLVFFLRRFLDRGDVAKQRLYGMVLQF